LFYERRFVVMLGKCGKINAILAVVIIVLTFWPNIISAVASKWIIIVAAALILWHAVSCKTCEPGAINLKKRK